MPVAEFRKNPTPALLAAALVLAPGGCILDLEGYNGISWCTEAIGANGTRQATNGNVPITKNADWITGCVILCPAEQDIMVDGEDGDFNMSHPLYDDWQDLRARAYLAGENRCLARVDQLDDAGAIVFTGAGDLTCGAAVALQQPFEGEHGLIPKHWCDHVGGETGTGGEESTSSDGGSASASASAEGADTTGADVDGPEIYGLTSYNQVRSCTTNTTAKTITCSLDREFIADVSADMALLWLDHATMTMSMTPAGVKGWRFSTCDSTSLMYALGLRVNDLIVSVDDHPVIDFDDGLTVWGELGQTSYTGTSAKAKFYRSGIVWTLTVNRTNFSTYP